MVGRKRKPTSKAAEAPKSSQSKRGPKPAGIQKAAAGRAAGTAAPKRGPIARNIEPAIDLEEENPAENEPEEPEPRVTSSPVCLTPEPAPEPEPIILVLDTVYQEDQITNDSRLLNSIDEFSYYAYKTEQEQLVARAAARAGYSHAITSFIALISHSKARNKPTLVDLNQSIQRWNEVRRFASFFHRDKKPDIQIELKMVFKRRKESARMHPASIEPSSDPPAIEKLGSQKLTPVVQAGLDAATAIRQPGSENAEFLRLLGKLQKEWKCKNKQCSNRDGYCIRLNGNTHGPLSLNEQREWVLAIQAGHAFIECAPIKLAAKKGVEVEEAKKRKKEASRQPAEPVVVAPILQYAPPPSAQPAAYLPATPTPGYGTGPPAPNLGYHPPLSYQNSGRTSGSPWDQLPEYERKRQWELKLEEEERWAQERRWERERQERARASSYRHYEEYSPDRSGAGFLYSLLQAPEHRSRYEDELSPRRRSSQRQSERASTNRRPINELTRSRSPGGRRNLASSLARSISPKATPRLVGFNEFDKSKRADLRAYFRWHILESPSEKPLFLQALRVLEAQCYILNSLPRLRFDDWLKLEVPTGLGERLAQEVDRFMAEFFARDSPYRGSARESERCRELSPDQRNQDSGELPNKLLLDTAIGNTTKLSKETQLPEAPFGSSIKSTHLSSEPPNPFLEPYPSRQPEIDVLTYDFKQLTPRKRRGRLERSPTISE